MDSQYCLDLIDTIRKYLKEKDYKGLNDFLNKSEAYIKKEGKFKDAETAYMDSLIKNL